MSGPRTHAARSGGRRRSPTRPLLAAGLLAAAVFGLSACRTIQDDPAAREPRATPPVQVASAPPPRETVAETTPAPAITTPDETRPEETSPTSSTPQVTTPAAATSTGTTPATGSGGEGEVKGTTASSEDAPAAPATDSDDDDAPWRLVGQPYLVDDESPQSSVTADSTTTFTLWFRTEGDFRGVRQGTSVTDDRHFKVGLIQVPDLPAYVPGGVGMVQRSERMLQKGRYCWTAELHVQGQRGQKRFPLRREGAQVQVVLDLRGAPVQRRTATVVTRTAPVAAGKSAPKSPAEEALACR